MSDKLLEAAVELVKEANKQVDEHMPGRLASIVKQHAVAGVGAAWIPIPGAAIAAAAAAVWGMYFRINRELGVPFSENIIKSIATGVATNLAAYLGVLAVGEGLKLIPGLGSIVGAVVLSAAQYALLLASGYVYMRILTAVFKKNRTGNVSDAEMRAAMDDVLKDKAGINDFVQEAKSSYKK